MRQGAADHKVETLLSKVVAGGYCIGCGVCAAIRGSPLSIDLDGFGCFRATLTGAVAAHGSDTDILAVCPFSAQSQDEDEIGERLYGEEARFDGRIGYYLSTYAGFVTERDFRERGGSGGMGKWILSKLLQDGWVDAVIHIVQNIPSASDPLLYRYCLATSVDEVRKGSKSVYYPIEMSRVLRSVREHPGTYAVIGLPCFIKAIRLLSMQDPVFKERIRFCVGLICGHLKSAQYANMFAWQIGIEPGNLVSIDFRKKIPSRPANEKGVEVLGFKNGEKVRAIGAVREFFGTDYNHGFLKYPACDYCDDVVAETADIAIGDAWLPAYLKDSGGTNVVIVRHPGIQAVLEREMSAAHLHLDRIGPSLIVKSQEAGFRHRREGLSYRLYLKDKSGAWRPPKRSEAQWTHIDEGRRRVYEFRMRMAEESREAFREAMGNGRFSVFQERMETLLSQYAELYRSAPPIRRMLRHVLEKPRALLRRLRVSRSNQVLGAF